jgi:hypothetical protein
MGHYEMLDNRLSALEARHVPSIALDCDSNRRLARHASYFSGRPWVCQDPINSEKKARRKAALARYKKYFDELEEIGL